MSNFVAIIFPDEKKAYEGVHAIKQLHEEGTVTLYSHAVVQRSAKGTLDYKETDLDGPIGTGLGALLGGLAGVFGGPVGMAAGLAAGTMLGASSDLFNLGVGSDFVEMIEKQLTPGKTAVVAEVGEEWTTPLDTRMQDIGGIVVREARDDFIDDQVNRRITTRKQEFAQRRAEFSAKIAGKKMESIERAVASAQEKLKRAAEDASSTLQRYRDETDAKLRTLEGQVQKATPQARSQIEKRISELRADGERRFTKVDEAIRTARKALE